MCWGSVSLYTLSLASDVNPVASEHVSLGLLHFAKHLPLKDDDFCKDKYNLTSPWYFQNLILRELEGVSWVSCISHFSCCCEGRKGFCLMSSHSA